MEAAFLVALVLLVGMASQWISWRLRIPAIVVLTVAGLVAGPVMGWVRPSAVLGNSYLESVELALAVILFEGGLNLKSDELRGAESSITRFVLLGIPLTWALGLLCARLTLPLSWSLAGLAAAVLVVSGPTVIIPVLRNLRLKRRLSAIVKWEGILNDPVGALFAVFIFEGVVALHALAPEASRSGPVALGLLSVALAVVAAVIAGRVFGRLLESGALPEFLKAPALIALVLSLFVVSNEFQRGAGLAAVTVFGMTLSGARGRGAIEVRRFVENLGVMLISAVFLLLAADFRVESLAGMDPIALVAFIGLMMLVVRPLTAWLCSSGTSDRLSTSERTFLAFFAPRGIVAAAMGTIFAARLETVGVTAAATMQAVIFVFVVTSVVIYGIGAPLLAGRLGVRIEDPKGILIVGAHPWALRLGRALAESGARVTIADTSRERLELARLGGFPVYFGEILSERAGDLVDLGTFKYVLAATDNDAYNALVSRRFADDLGADRVFQLPAREPQGPGRFRVGRESAGQTAFTHSAGLDRLEGLARQKWEIVRSQLPADDPEDRRVPARPGFIPLMAVRPDGQVVFKRAGGRLLLRPGDVLISFSSQSEDEPLARSG